ncbi:NRDE family protein [Endozoicomonas sp. SM1973]|uniref:NRDE family protein n=1 Tax=Spartinivicinus marinus TaxID=2994442 RepID=A0A853IEZ2_9GAMM|nr:NRDE family protein [Spartinivicinus marinus]MCX4029115.1 NRDE family protein [Spartinivicinus marinus]NYZ67735.1 NRDE family protein [Spartinivicinus marinus]
MCTISWLVHNDHYEVFFNRDEQKSRVAALPPQLVNHSPTLSLMPIDPVGGGSWLATTEYGQVIALLNLYQADIGEISSEQQSRGLLVHQLASFTNWQAQQLWLRQLDYNLYRPFSLFIFTPTWHSNKQLKQLLVHQFDWDNQTLQQQQPKQPFFSSSSVATQAVLANRHACYKALGYASGTPTPIQSKSSPLTTRDLLQLHRSHQPSASAYSICMHREDAQTVSFSHIKINQQQTEFDYYPDSPCQPHEPQRFQLKCQVADIPNA